MLYCCVRTHRSGDGILFGLGFLIIHWLRSSNALEEGCKVRIECIERHEQTCRALLSLRLLKVIRQSIHFQTFFFLNKSTFSFVTEAF